MFDKVYSNNVNHPGANTGCYELYLVVANVGRAVHHHLIGPNPTLTVLCSRSEERARPTVRLGHHRFMPRDMTSFP